MSFGLPEFVATLLMGAAIVPITLWLQALPSQVYRITEGSVVHCELHPTHYNATDFEIKVALTYQYVVGTTTYTKTWNGLWPETGSPNALPVEKLDALTKEKFPLTVYYDAERPTDSSLFVEARGYQRIYGGLAVAMCGLAILYCAVGYPAWRNV